MITKENGCNLFAYFEGEININSINEFGKDMDKLESEANMNIVLNLSQVSYINSLGLGTIIDVYKKLKAKGRNLKIVCDSAMVREILGVVKFDKLIPIYYNDEEVI